MSQVPESHFSRVHVGTEMREMAYAGARSSKKDGAGRSKDWMAHWADDTKVDRCPECNSLFTLQMRKVGT